MDAVLQKPNDISSKFKLWKLDLDRTQGYTLEAILGRSFDQGDLRYNKRLQRVLQRRREGMLKRMSHGGKDLEQLNQVVFHIDNELKYLCKQQLHIEEDIANNKEKLKIYLETHPFKFPDICGFFKRIAARFKRRPAYVNPPGLKSSMKHNQKDGNIRFSDCACVREFDEDLPATDLSDSEEIPIKFDDTNGYTL
ncbi:hypothetical protein HDV04_001915 [Boothiomyces sp. JEL0838]|nr:hypothetical protein HDV04_001890 [Boothiomyces sp. JEL0838]KAJ3313486.1 hypothetical protein HDV04_001915 [Boothiomyces sp. JEL0838]